MRTPRLLSSFADAFQGLGRAVAKEQNLRIHLGATVAVVAAGLALHIAPREWAILALTIGFVVAMELINTALEAVVDLTTRELHPLAKLAKDVSAGAVLVASLAAVGVGVLILGPYLLARLR